MLINITNVKFRVYNDNSELIAVTNDAIELLGFLIKKKDDFKVVTDVVSYVAGEFWKMYESLLKDEKNRDKIEEILFNGII